MATMTSGFMTTFLPRLAGIEPGVWTSSPNPFIYATESGATHNGERTWSPTQSYRTFGTASTYAMAGFEARTLLGTGGAPGNNWLFAFCQGSPSTVVATLRVDAAGIMYLVNGAGTSLGNSGASVIGSNSTYYTVECALGNVGAGACILETRLNGARIPSLTTSGFGAAGGQPAGTMGVFSTGTLGTISMIVVAHNSTAQTPVIYYYWQKNGSSPWTTVDTNATPPVTFAQKTDFVGQKKRAWLNPSAAGNYTLAAGNWDDGLLTYPASIADSTGGTPGMDSDNSYIKNIVSGTAVSADKVSHAYTDLPGTATNVAFVQRTVFSRWDQVNISDTIRSGVRITATDFMDPDSVVTSGYSAGGTSLAGSVYYPQMPVAVSSTTVWSATTVNALEGILEQRAFT